MLDIFLKWLIPFVCGGVVSVLGMLAAQIKKNRKREKAVENGVQCLLRAEIIRQYEKNIDRGYCPLYTKEALKRGYDAYHELGGNDVATDLYHKIMKLPPERTVENE